MARSRSNLTPSSQLLAQVRGTRPTRTCSLSHADMLAEDIERTRRVSVRRRQQRVGRSPRPLGSVCISSHGAFYRLRELKARARSSRDRYLTDPETGVASGETEAAICVQNVDVQCVLQFTLIHAAGCVLHRHTSRVIHRLEFSFWSHSLLSREQALTDESHQTTETYCGKKR